MRLHGNFLDRLLYCWIPYTVIALIVIQSVKKPSLIFTLVILGLMLIVWIGECMVYTNKKLATLRVDNGIYINDMHVFPNDIVSIKRIANKGRFFDFSSLMIEFRKDGLTKTVRILEKPITIVDVIKNRRSKTLPPLIKLFPELTNRIAEEVS